MYKGMQIQKKKKKILSKVRMRIVKTRYYQLKLLKNIQNINQLQMLT